MLDPPESLDRGRVVLNDAPGLGHRLNPDFMKDARITLRPAPGPESSAGPGRALQRVIGARRRSIAEPPSSSLSVALEAGVTAARTTTCG